MIRRQRLVAVTRLVTLNERRHDVAMEEQAYTTAGEVSDQSDSNGIPPNLRDIKAEVDAGGTPQRKVKTLLYYFNQRGRGHRVRSRINAALAELGLRTEPSYESVPKDYRVRFVAIDASNASAAYAEPEQGDVLPADTVLPEVEDDEQADIEDDEAETLLPDESMGDGEAEDGDVTVVTGTPLKPDDEPTRRVGILDAANRVPTMVAPDDSVAKAVQIMMQHDFSQLPVGTGIRSIKGIITWQSIAERAALGGTCGRAGDCVEAQPYYVDVEDNLLTVATLIRQHERVLVRRHGAMCGLLTSADMVGQFERLAGPFLIIEDIEKQVRNLISSAFTLEAIQAAKPPEQDPNRRIKSAADLTFGEMQRFLDRPQHWQKLGTPLDRSTFVRMLDDVREIRNDVMHFNPDGLEEAARQKLRRAASFLERLSKISARS